MKITHIVGNRPQFVKLSLFHRAWQRKGGEKAVIIHTGQHFNDNMSAIFFREFRIPDPDFQLQIHSLPPGEMIGRMLAALDGVLATHRPDGIVVYGDTNTTLAGALAAKKRGIPLAHIEAGIRTGKEDMPEESNRYLADRLADYNFACTSLGLSNLLREGYTLGTGTPGPDAAPVPSRSGATGAIHSLVYNPGDLMFDAALLFKDRAIRESGQLAKMSLEGRPFVLATIHRGENLEDPAILAGILQALHRIHKDIPIVFPVHPRTQKIINQLGIPLHLHTTPPLGYLDMLAMVQSCNYVITDSGGLSREAFFFQKPALVIMQKPFWPEIFEHGPSLAAGSTPAEIMIRWNELLHRADSHPFRRGIFGDGQAGEKIAEILLDHLNSPHV